jgi:hypothetical protein
MVWCTESPALPCSTLIATTILSALGGPMAESLHLTPCTLHIAHVCQHARVVRAALARESSVPAAIAFLLSVGLTQAMATLAAAFTIPLGGADRRRTSCPAARSGSPGMLFADAGWTLTPPTIKARQMLLQASTMCSQGVLHARSTSCSPEDAVHDAAATDGHWWTIPRPDFARWGAFSTTAPRTMRDSETNLYPSTK